MFAFSLHCVVNWRRRKFSCIPREAGFGPHPNKVLRERKKIEGKKERQIQRTSVRERKSQRQRECKRKRERARKRKRERARERERKSQREKERARESQRETERQRKRKWENARVTDPGFGFHLHMATTPLSLAFEDFLKAPIGNKSQKVATKSHFLPQKKGEGESNGSDHRRLRNNYSICQGSLTVPQPSSSVEN